MTLNMSILLCTIAKKHRKTLTKYKGLINGRQDYHALLQVVLERLQKNICFECLKHFFIKKKHCLIKNSTKNVFFRYIIF